MTNSRQQSMISIRKLDHNDRADVRRIACETAFLGESLASCFDDDEILADALTLYFTDYEPDSCLVAVDEDRVVGYVTGAKNSATMRRVFRAKVMPRLFRKAVLTGTCFRPKAWRFLFHVMMSFLRGEFCTPDVSREYPATLHINVDARFRGTKVGTQLMDRYLGFLKSEAVPGVHVNTMSERARSFFQKQGFGLLAEGKRTFLRYCLRRDLPFYILGKRL